MTSLAERLLEEADNITCNATARLLRDAAYALEQAASLIFDGQPLHDRDTPDWLQWCLDARAWLNLHDGGFNSPEPQRGEE